MVKPLLLIAALSLLAGCSQAPATHYRVMLDPSLSVDAATAATQALDTWASKTGHQDLFEVTMAPCDVAADRGEPGQICIGHSNAVPTERCAELVAWTDGAGGVIRISDRADTVLYQAIAHEIGHAMGLVHTGEGTLMAPRPAVAAQDVTDADVQQWRAVRGSF